MSTSSSSSSRAALPSVASSRLREPSALKLSLSSTNTMKPRVVESVTSPTSQVGSAAFGLSLKHSVTGACRFTASVRAISTPVTTSFAAAVIRPLRWNSMRFGTPMPSRMPATRSVIRSSQSVNPCWRRVSHGREL